jgi:hypothetical protein
LDLPDGVIPDLPNKIGTPESNDEWHKENHLLRLERGDTSRSATPVNAPFIWDESE